MATRRSNRSNSSSRTSSRTRSKSRPTNKGGNKAAPAIIAIVILGGIVLAFSFLGNHKAKPKVDSPKESSSNSSENASNPQNHAREASPKNSTAHHPPSLTKEESLALDRLYEEAKQSWNEALKIKDTDRAQFVAKRDHAGKLIEELIDKVRPILDWQEEADMNDWPIPYEVNDLMRRFNKWTKLQATVHRMSSLKK